MAVATADREFFSHQAAPRRVQTRSARRWSTVLSAVALAIVVPVWFKTLAPRTLGGQATYVQIQGTSMLPTFDPGDLVILHQHAVYAKGDVVAYRVPEGDFGEGLVVIHRIVGGSASDGFEMLGDNNPDLDSWRPSSEDVIGKAWLRFPKVGLLFRFLHAPVPLASLAAGITVAVIAIPKKREDQL
jgi:signal peptidase I